MENAVPNLATLPRRVLKRDGQQVPFDAAKIEAAILKAGRATGEFGELEASLLTAQVVKVLAHRYGASADSPVSQIPTPAKTAFQTSRASKTWWNRR